jgi:hypothetical protein
VKGGAFFAPISLENDGIGWTSTWTLTRSAIEDRGWTFTGSPLGLFDHVRLSNIPGQPGLP